MFFTAPPVIEAKPFTRVPKELDLSDRPSAWAHRQARGPIGAFLEGPSFDRDGNLWLVDIAHGRIFRVSPAGDWDVVAQYDGQPNGLKIHRDGRVFIADFVRGIMVLDPANGRRSSRSSAASASPTSRASTTSSSPRTGTSTSPTRASPGCTTPPAGCGGTGPRTGVSSASSTPSRARTGWSWPATSRCSTSR